MIMYSASSTGGQSRAVSPTTTIQITTTTMDSRSYRERRCFAAWPAAPRWISSEPERCNSGFPSPEPTGRTAGPRSAWTALHRDRKQRETVFFHQLCLLQSVTGHLKLLSLRFSQSSMNGTGLHSNSKSPRTAPEPQCVTRNVELAIIPLAFIPLSD